MTGALSSRRPDRLPVAHSPPFNHTLCPRDRVRNSPHVRTIDAAGHYAHAVIVPADARADHRERHIAARRQAASQAVGADIAGLPGDVPGRWIGHRSRVARGSLTAGLYGIDGLAVPEEEALARFRAN